MAKKSGRRRRPIDFVPMEFRSQLVAAITRKVSSSRLAVRRDGIALALGLHGLRVSEVVALRIDDLRPVLRRLYVRTTKRGEEREIELDASLVQAILDWRRDTGAMLPHLIYTVPRGRLPKPVRREHLWRMCKTTLRQIGLPGGFFHLLRHTCGTWIVQATGDVWLAKTTLGHRSVKTTEIYVHAAQKLPRQLLVDVSAPRQLCLFIEPSGA